MSRILGRLTFALMTRSSRRSTAFRITAGKLSPRLRGGVRGERLPVDDTYVSLSAAVGNRGDLPSAIASV